MAGPQRGWRKAGKRALVAMLLLALTAPRAARADEPDLAAAPDRARLAIVQATLEKDASSSRLWYFGWSGIYAVATGVQLTIALTTSDAGLRADTRVGAVTAGLGFLVTAVLPPPSLFHSPCTDSEEAALASCLARQEQRLAEAASAERLGHSWLAHAGEIAVNVGAGLFLWRHDDRLGSGILTAVTGIAVSELQIYTTPTQARDAPVLAALRDVKLAVVPTAGGGALLAAGRPF